MAKFAREVMRNRCRNAAYSRRRATRAARVREKTSGPSMRMLFRRFWNLRNNVNLVSFRGKLEAGK